MKKELKLLCTCDRSEYIYYGKFMSLLFQNKNFIMTSNQSPVYLRESKKDKYC